MSKVEFLGEDFELNGDISQIAILEFAEAAADGEDGDTMQGMASVMRLLRECVAAKDWGRFRALCRSKKATVEQMQVVIKAAFEGQTDRPTGQPSDSSDGLQVIEPKPESSSDGKASLPPVAGRPDKQLALVRMRPTG